MRFIFSILLLSSLAFGQKIVSHGTVLVNGEEVTAKTNIQLGDVVETKKGASVRFSINKDAFFAKSNAKFTFKKKGESRVLEIVNGGVMAVFGGGKHAVSTPNMTAGIRGTGVFALVKDGKTYFCTCHGETIVRSQGKTKISKASHHKMLWITPKGIKETKDMQKHEDHEIVTLEAMVGRTLAPIFHQK